MRSFLTILLLCFWGNHAPAQASEDLTAIEVRTQFNVQNGKKSFYASWFPSYQAATFLLGLNATDELPFKYGFDLSKATSYRLLNPVLPEGCELVRLTGLVPSRESRRISVSFDIRGQSCKEVLDEFTTANISIELLEVPSSSIHADKADLVLYVDDLPSRDAP